MESRRAGLDAMRGRQRGAVSYLTEHAEDHLCKLATRLVLTTSFGTNHIWATGLPRK